MMLQNVGTSYFLSVDKLCQDSNESGYTVIQEVRTWIDPQAYWFMAPLWMGRSFRPLWSTTKRLLPCRVVIRPIACTSCLYLSWISDLPWSGYRLCLCISACSPYFHNLFDLVSGLCSNVSFPSEILPKYSEWWLLHSSCVLCDGHSSVLRTLLWLTLTGLHSKTTWEYFLLESSLLASAGFQLLYPRHSDPDSLEMESSIGYSSMYTFDPCWIFATIMLQIMCSFYKGKPWTLKTLTRA